ncbi:DUF5615 family PIN-like protein [Raineya sp.]
MADYLNKKGLDNLHTLQLPDSNRSTDEFICQIADSDQRCLITKDKDFWHSYFLKNTPKKLLIVT